MLPKQVPKDYLVFCQFLTNLYPSIMDQILNLVRPQSALISSYLFTVIKLNFKGVVLEFLFNLFRELLP